MIGIVNYGIGNVGAIENMLRRLGAEVKIAATPDELENADKIVLPGVGAFDAAMEAIGDQGWIPVLLDMVEVQLKPILGVCLGMHLWTGRSEEGSREGLGLIEARTVRFNFEGNGVKIPHMGWNTATPAGGHGFTEGLAPGTRFYFVHSYYVVLENEEDAMLMTEYGGKTFVSAFKRKGILGVQFHPEKSHLFGKDFLARFVEL